MDHTETIKTEAQELLQKIINSFEIDVTRDEDIYHVIIKSDADAPTVIGRHGETIRAIQKILEVILYKKTGEPVHILVNVNDYREKQKERLEGIAAEAARRVEESKRPTSLRRFSSYERKLIHEYITNNYENLTTYSTGEGRDRELIVDLKENAKQEE